MGERLLKLVIVQRHCEGRFEAPRSNLSFAYERDWFAKNARNDVLFIHGSYKYGIPNGIPQLSETYPIYLDIGIFFQEDDQLFDARWTP